MSPISEGHQRTPILLRRELASELRRLRSAAGLTRKQASAHLFCDSSKISRIETGRVTASPRDVRDLLQLYGVTGQQRDDLLRLACDARQREPWWHAYGDLPDVRTYVAFEEAAVSICSYESFAVPGLLQVEEYARLIIAAVLPDLHHETVERLVELRMTRQSMLCGDDPVTLRVVLDEAAIPRMISERKIMRRQLHHLIEAADMPKVTVQLLPFSAGPHPGMAGPFTILGFADAADQDVVYLESLTGDVYLDQPDQLNRYRAKFEHLQAVALPPDESTAFLVELARSCDLR
jgi:transcriptional regulator with XRE-family HTH domain